jgi:23S rRNA (uracil1939-C5)-methyltransferase
MGGLPVTGFYRPGSHEIVPIQECLLEPEAANKVIRAVMEALPKLRVAPYDEKKHEGTLRHLIVRTGFRTQEVLLMFVINAKEFPQGRALAREAMYKSSKIVSVTVNSNTEKTNVILGKETRVIEGRAFYSEAVENLKFNISSNSFFQINTDQALQICRTVAQYADLHGEEIVTEVYSGAGMIGLFLSRGAQRVYGIENNAQAVEDARINAQINKIRNVKFVCVDAAEGLLQMKKEGIKPNVIVLDPPRQGCGEAVLTAAMDLKPQRMVYVSCDPATLARDLALLSRHGYETVEVQPIDMFPQTSHIESVVLVKQRQLGLI